MSAPKARRFSITEHETELGKRESTKPRKKALVVLKILLYIPIGLLCLFALICIGYLAIGALTASS